ncbi:MAG: 30S ribosome-binding factor RbfA [Crocinitomicaceae bacterium]|nr:30S ribosome-binding factor RbfA [Crocinitomicaceae bacterium]
MATVRLEKICALLKRELSVIFQQNMKTMFGDVMITVTNVRISPDMGVAKVYLSFFLPEKKEYSITQVKEQAAHIRKLLGDSIAKQIRKIPELHFYLDDSLDYFEEINRLLKKK